MKAISLMPAIGPLCGVLLLLSAFSAHSYQYTPSEEVWLAWPEVCRVKYPAFLNIEMKASGMGAEYRNFYDPVATRNWIGLLGEESWAHLHHYCAGLGYIISAEREYADERMRDFYWRSAADELYYSLHHDRLTSPMAPKIVSALGKVLPKIGETEDAKRHLREVIDVQPTAIEAFAALATIVKREGDLKGAIALLEQAHSVQSKPSAELSYILGSYYLDDGQFSKARSFAGVAYDLGYPLKGLRNRLEKAGHW